MCSKKVYFSNMARSARREIDQPDIDELVSKNAFSTINIDRKSSSMKETTKFEFAKKQKFP